MGKAWNILGPDHEVKEVAELLTYTTINEYVDADIISTDISVLSQGLLKRFNNLKLIAIRSTGVDVIDRVYCHNKGITLCNVPTYAQNTVAEHVFALLLCIKRHMVKAVSRTRSGHFSWEGIQSAELYGKTMTVIGTGAIGRRVSEIAKGFGLDVVACDVKPSRDWALANGITYQPMTDALRMADIISLHVPAMPETYHLISDDQFAQFLLGHA